MTYKREKKAAFAVIGMEGSTDEGGNFIAKLWDRANARFSEIENLVIKTESGVPAGIWGLMSNKSREFKPWENGFSEGLYLAGAEVPLDAEAPQGWVKWISPGYEYIVADAVGPEYFGQAIKYLADNGLSLAGAAYDRTIFPQGRHCSYLPIKKL